jgi:hypothetical protein
MHTEVLRLQATAGNAAVAGLLRTRRLIQRDPQEKAGWTDADKNVDPAVGFSWNKDMHLVGSVGRYPLQGLAEGLQEDVLDKGSASAQMTTESARGRAIALVPSRIEPNNPVKVLLHLHGYAETTGRPYAGWRTHSTTHKVRDVEHDRIAQQIEAAQDPQIIGLLPQGGEESQFSKSGKKPYDTFAADPYLDEVLGKLVKVGALKSLPKERRVILAAHSGGGHTIRSMLEGENQKRAGGKADGFSSPPAALAATPRFRGYYGEGGFYVDRYTQLDTAIKKWFADNGKALGPYADKVWPLFQVVAVPGLGKTKSEKHEAIVRGHALGDTKAPVAGTVTDALKTLDHPTAPAPRPPESTPATKGAGTRKPRRAPAEKERGAAAPGRSRGLPAGAITSSRLKDFGDEEATAFRKAVYDEQLRRTLANPEKHFSPGLADEEKGDVEGNTIHKFAEADARGLLKRARDDWTGAKQAGDPLATKCRSIGVGNAYRDPERDFRAWQNTFAKHYEKTAAAREKLPGGPHGEAAVKFLARWLSPKKAVPGFSNHTKGLAIDFVTVQNGVELGANTDQKDAWQAAWFHHWLVDNAKSFRFSPLASEEWHWDHDAGVPNTAGDAATVGTTTAAGAPKGGATDEREERARSGARGTAPEPQPDGHAGTDEIAISWGSNANQSVVAARSLEILRDVLRAAGLRSATITSTARTPTDQARAMYQNLVGRGRGKGVEAQHRLYGPGGDAVIDTFVELRDAGKTPAEIKEGMRAKIVAVGPTHVSRHCGDPDVLNVFDVGPASIGDDDNQTAFVRAARAEEGKRISKFIAYPGDPGHHFEIPPG